MSMFNSLLVSAQELLITIVENRLHRQNRLLLDSDSDVEMSDLEFFDEPVPIGHRTRGIWHSGLFGTYAGGVQSHRPCR